MLSVTGFDVASTHPVLILDCAEALRIQASLKWESCRDVRACKCDTIIRLYETCSLITPHSDG